VDILHTHGFKSDILGYFATRGLGVGLVTTPHGWCDHESFRIRAYETVGRVFLRGFDRIYPLSDHQSTMLAPYHLGAKVRRIRNAVDIVAFDAIHRDRGPTRRDTLLFVGRLAREKGLLDLLEAASMIVADRQFEITIVGEGPAAEEAEALTQRLGISERVRFMGFQEDVRPFLARAALLALPSYSEGIPRVVMEAFAAGVPVVGTRIPGLEELVQSGQTGLLVPLGDVAALAGALTSLLTNDALARSLADQARLVIERDYSPRRLAAELRQEYEALASQRRSRADHE
jgi:glycosyltransferase involved in cell wall biosynthesis